MNGRIYDPVLGQFMQADNNIQTPEDYIGYDRYNYVRGNPFKYTDPSGEYANKWQMQLNDRMANAEQYDIQYQWMGTVFAEFEFEQGLAQQRIEGENNDMNEYLVGVAQFHAAWAYSLKIFALMQSLSLRQVLRFGSSSASSSTDTEDDKNPGVTTEGNEPYKQYPLEKTSKGNYKPTPKYKFTSTLTNASDKPIYYKPEDGNYGKTYVVMPGHYIIGDVDGFTTSLYTDEVYKSFGKYGARPDCFVGPNGTVNATLGWYDKILLKGNGPDYTWGWRKKYELPVDWHYLFDLANPRRK